MALVLLSKTYHLEGETLKIAPVTRSLGYEHVVYGADSLIFLANFLLKQVKLIACVCNFGVKIRNKNIKYFDVYHKRTKSRITKLQIKGNKKFK